MTKNVLTDILSEPLNGATTAMVNIDAGDGNLTIGHLHWYPVRMLLSARAISRKSFGKLLRAWLAC